MKNTGKTKGEEMELVGKAMWVWNGSKSNPKDAKAWVLVKLKSGRCYALSSQSFLESTKSAQENGLWWDRCADIEKEKAKKWIPCECRKDLPARWLDGWLKDPDGRISSVKYYSYKQDGTFFHGTWKNMFEDYLWSLTFDGPWQPIGKIVEVDGK